jgi:hypothetical protein
MTVYQWALILGIYLIAVGVWFQVIQVGKNMLEIQHLLSDLKNRVQTIRNALP